MPPKKGSKAAGSMGDPSLCRHGGPRATSHILECLNMMINHNKFGVSEEDFALCADDEEKVRAVLLKKMKTFMISHPEAASDDSIKTLVAMAVDELLLNGDLENARLFYQPVPFLRFFKKYGVKGLEERQTALSKAADTVNGVAEVKGMLDTLKVDVGNSCKCLSLFTPGAPLKPQAKEPAGATYEQCLTLPFLKIPVKRLNAMGQDSRLHVEIRRLCAPNDHPPYLCIIIAPASRYIFHSFPIDETDAEKAFMHVLEAIVMAVVSEGMGMIDEAVRIRPAQLTVTDPLLAKYLSPLLEGTRVSVAASSDKVINADSDAKTKETPLIAIMDGVYADFNVDLLKARTTHKLPIGDTMAEEAKFKVKSRTASGKEKYVADPAAEERDIPVRMMACKGCKLLMPRKVVKQCSLCSEVWYCGSDCQSSDWSAGHKTECNRKNEGKKTNKGAGHVSEDSGDDLRDHARNEALDSFAIDLVKAVPAGGAKKKGGGKKGKGKGKKK